MTGSQNKQRKHMVLLGLVAVSMFGFAYALVPLYEIFCDITGFNGRTFSQTTAAEAPSDAIGREVTIQFLSKVGRGMPWEFRPTESRMQVRVGEVSETRYYARNYANQIVTGQAVPSVTPGFAAPSLHKIECFCFTQQTLEAGEEVEMPVRFYVDDDLPADVGTLTLSYSLYPVSASKMASVPIEEVAAVHTEEHAATHTEEHP